MNDLIKAEDILKAGGCGLVFVCGGKIIKRDGRGIAPLLELVESGEELKDFCVADKIVGKAAALLYAYAGVSAVYGEAMSVSAECVFKEHGIAYCCGEKTEKIINRTGDGLCPMETAVQSISSPQEAVTALRKKVDSLRGVKSD